jgi:phytoene synthase
MQLTNILRDVGEDWRTGRLYLPAELLRRRGVDEATVATVAEAGAPVPAPYRAVLEELMDHADGAYDEALEAVPALPSWYRRPVVVAARAYQAIHDEIRRNDYDNGTRRARTSISRKLVAGTRSLVQLAARGGTADPVVSSQRAVDTPAESHG